MNRLVVIGNGFDLAHGLRTDYGSFLENMSPEIKEQWMEICDRYLDEEDKKKTSYWNEFERNIGQITLNIFNKLLNSFEDNTYTPQMEIEYRDNLDRISKIFRPITSELQHYLSEVQKNQITPIQNILKYFNQDTTVLNFNYTNTAELYADNIYHFHGSLSDNNIVFGYSRRNEYDPIEGKSTEFSKFFYRKLNHYHTFLIHKNMIESKIKEELTIYQNKLPLIYNGKGAFEWGYSEELLQMIQLAKENIPAYPITEAFYISQFFPEHIYGKEIADRARKERIVNTSPSFAEYAENCANIDFNMLDEMNLGTIEEIVFIGHSLVGDWEIFEEIA